MRAHLLVVLLASSVASAAEPLKGWSWLVGDWVTESKPGEGTGGFSLQPDLDGKVLVRKNEANYPATKDRPAQSHRDLMIVEGAKATYWDNEGHVIVYAVVTEPEKIVLTSEPAPGPRFRLTYSKRADGKVGVLFELAAPNAPDTFKKYLEGVVKPAAKP